MSTHICWGMNCRLEDEGCKEKRREDESGVKLYQPAMANEDMVVRICSPTRASSVDAATSELLMAQTMRNFHGGTSGFG